MHPEIVVWQEDLLDSAKFAIEWLILFRRRTDADSPASLDGGTGTGFKKVQEPEVTHEIYRVMSEMGYLRKKVANMPYIGKEQGYHVVPEAGNIPRTDLLVKDFGRGLQFNYVELKSFSTWNSRRQELLRKDTRKLHENGGSRGKYCLIYHVKTGSNLWDTPTIRNAVNERCLEPLGRRSLNGVMVDGNMHEVQIGLFKCRRIIE